MADFLEVLKEYQFLVGAATGSLAAWIVSQVWTYLRREKRWLGYSTTSRNIVQPARGHANLTVQYDGRDIQRLDSHSIQLINLGNRVITNVPVRLECQGSIVKHDVRVPDGANYEATLDGPSALVVKVDLLNPKELFIVGLTVADDDKPRVKVIARAEYLKVREISERTTGEVLKFFFGTSPMFLIVLKTLLRHRHSWVSRL